MLKITGPRTWTRSERAVDDQPPMVRNRGHFRFNTVSALFLVLFLVMGLAAQALSSGFLDSKTIAYLAGGVFGAAAVIAFLPFWPTVVVAIACLWAVPPVVLEGNFFLFAAVITPGLLIAPGFEVINQWDKAVLLRLGKFHRVRGPGIIFLLPLVDSVAGYVDTRIRVSDFSAEKSLTLDTVPVHVDALAFWMIWDPMKAVLEVQDFQQAVTLSAQTALRSCIGSNTLTTLLCERERLGEDLQRILDEKTNPWGITLISVEFKEILVPEELEDALSRVAQAEREKKSREILGEAEVAVSSKYAEAANLYRGDPTALRLRAMSMIYESMRNKGGLVLVPSSALETMNLGPVFGAASYGAAAGAVPDVLPEAVKKAAGGGAAEREMPSGMEGAAESERSGPHSERAPGEEER